MPPTFSPKEACSLVTEATGFHLDPKMLRTWRNRGLLLSFEQGAEGAWTRYSVTDVFTIAVMAHGLRAGYTARTAANIARIARDYAPGTDGSDATGILLALPGITSGDADGEATFQHRIRMHKKDAAHLFGDEFRARFGSCLIVILPLSEMRESVLRAVEADNAV